MNPVVMVTAVGNWPDVVSCATQTQTMEDMEKMGASCLIWVFVTEKDERETQQPDQTPDTTSGLQ